MRKFDKNTAELRPIIIRALTEHTGGVSKNALLYLIREAQVYPAREEFEGVLQALVDSKTIVVDWVFYKLPVKK